MVGVLRAFWRNDDAAVTADWVVLTAAIVALNVLGIIAFLEGGLVIASNSILSSLLEADGAP